MLSGHGGGGIGVVGVAGHAIRTGLERIGRTRRQAVKRNGRSDIGHRDRHPVGGLAIDDRSVPHVVVIGLPMPLHRNQ